MFDHIWCEKYRPKTIKDCILPDELKENFQKIVDGGEVPNMMFTGSPGLGKTTVAKAICNELGLDYIVVNGSEEGNIDTLRGKIKQFASSISLSGGYKVVILDEADYLNAQSTQPALRGFIEEFSKNCRFILTCNFKNRIISPLHSRCVPIEFNTDKKILSQLCVQFFKRLKVILDGEGVAYKDNVIADIIYRYAPDWRRVFGICQQYALSDGLTKEFKSQDKTFKELFSIIKQKNFRDMRKWIVNNIDIEPAAMFRGIYDSMNEYVEPQSIPQLVLILADYQYKNAFVADHELNMVACLTEIMSEVNIK